MAHNNIISAHTADGCTQDSSIDGLYIGQQLNTQCAVGTENIGCGFNPSPDDVSSYGDGFNAAHGGVYAMEWNEEHIRIWHFARGSIPGDIENKEPDPESWGQPVAIFGGSSCDVDTYFKNMRLVLNIVSTYMKNTFEEEMANCDNFNRTFAETMAMPSGAKQTHATKLRQHAPNTWQRIQRPLQTPSGTCDISMRTNFSLGVVTRDQTFGNP